jgi:hypothetical protein
MFYFSLLDVGVAGTFPELLKDLRNKGSRINSWGSSGSAPPPDLIIYE